MKSVTYGQTDGRRNDPKVSPLLTAGDTINKLVFEEHTKEQNIYGSSLVSVSVPPYRPPPKNQKN